MIEKGPSIFHRKKKIEILIQTSQAPHKAIERSRLSSCNSWEELDLEYEEIASLISLVEDTLLLWNEG